MLLFLLVTCVSLFTSITLFRKAAGTLSLGKLNIVSYVFYLTMLQTVIGCLLVNLGYNKHYTLQYLITPERSIRITTYAIFFMIMVLPLVMLFVFKLFRMEPAESYSDFLEKKVVNKDNTKLFVVLVVVTIIQLALLIIYLRAIGYVPIVKLFTGNDGFDYSIERQRIAAISFGGKLDLIMSLLLFMAQPLVSYIAFAYALSNKKASWGVLAAVAIIISIIIETRNFSKSPLIFHFAIYLLIVIYHKKGVRNWIMVLFAALCVCILMFYYRVEGYEGSFTDIYNGILGRTLFTQFGTLCYHFDLFPEEFPFLKGRSLYPTILRLLGREPEEHLRSARLVMEYYGSKHVYAGTAGVMNANFIGEAYANWGNLGLIFSVVWVAVVISLIFILILKMRKTPSTIAFLAAMTVTIGNATQGGFVDFIYSSSLIMKILIFMIFIYPDKVVQPFKFIFSRRKRTA